MRREAEEREEQREEREEEEEPYARAEATAEAQLVDAVIMRGPGTGSGDAGAVPLPQPRQDSDPNALTRMGKEIKKPATGATVAGALVLGAASVLGVTEAALAAAAAYGTYRMLEKRRSRRAG
jgi:hypothetical protein